jgi:hypothetical protein
MFLSYIIIFGSNKDNERISLQERKIPKTKETLETASNAEEGLLRGQ